MKLNTIYERIVKFKLKIQATKKIKIRQTKGDKI